MRRATFFGSAVTAVAIALLAAAVAAVVGAAVANNFITDVQTGRASAREVDWIITVESEVLREIRDLRVRLPHDYNSDEGRRYPVLLVLDGEWHLDHIAGAVENLEWLGLGASMIVVGVVNGVAGRSVDFVPAEHVNEGVPARADRFLEFLEHEAIPAVDRDLRTDSTRVIAGHSLGGMFVIYTLVKRPDLFVGRVAFSPSMWRKNGAMVDDLRRFLETSPSLNSYLYTSVGTLESHGMRTPFYAARSALETITPIGLHVDVETMDGADHDTNPIRSTPRALRGFWEYWTGDRR